MSVALHLYGKRLMLHTLTALRKCSLVDLPLDKWRTKAWKLSAVASNVVFSARPNCRLTYSAVHQSMRDGRATILSKNPDTVRTYGFLPTTNCIHVPQHLLVIAS
jgi:hypothetical protein